MPYPCINIEDVTEQKAKLNDVLKEGKVELAIIKCMCQGPAQVGKTHVKSLVMKKPLKIKSSTNPVEKAVRAVCTEKRAIGDSWEEINTQKLIDILANRAKTQPEPNQKSKVQSEAILQDNDSQEIEPKNHPGLVGKDPATSRLKFLGKILKQMAEQNQDLTILSQKWVYFVDSGGQSQFHNFFQAFVPNTSVLLLVFKLTEKLSKIPKNYYFGNYLDLKGNNATIEDTLRSISSTLCTSGNKARVLCVGTFRDEYDKMNEEQKQEVGSIDGKSAQLKTLFKQCHLQHCFSADGSEVIFPVNGLQAEKEVYDDKVVIEIRKQITKQDIETESLPLSRFALELALEEKAEGCEVLTFETCEEIAFLLQICKLL